ncbi:MAG TPA: SH3 domain-containing protein [Thermoanaerobaculia bacterium]|nr:SH3 domain-containing protein [Thermoanaerobaculia bacterium]
MKRFAVLLLIVAAFACTQKPKIASNADVTGIRPPIDVEYVAIPSMTVYARPDIAAQPIGSYGFSESIAVLSKQGDWCEIRTYDGSGWVKATDLMTADQAKSESDHPVPHFYVQPAMVAYNGHGEIVLQAKVNTEGQVFDVLQVSNSTKNAKLADENAMALRQAQFYPLIEKGQRKTFIYEHRVVY